MSFAAGIGIGCLYFLGLRYSVDYCLTKKTSLWLFALSYILRIAGAIVAIQCVADGQWERYLAALGGFAAAKILLVHHVAKRSDNGNHA